MWSIAAEDLSAAVDAVREHARETPLVEASALGAGIYLKLESEQETGSFKLRGALSALAALDPAARARGVLTASAGNHGAGLAHAGRLLDVPVTVYVAASTPAVKRARISAAGATLVIVQGASYDRTEAQARAAAERRGIPFVSPFDDPRVAAGNGGTVALEILSARPSVQTIVAPVGGGGLVAGLAAARRLRGASFELVGVQSEACPAMARSIEEGAARLTYEGLPTLAEGLEGGVSQTTFELARAQLARMDLVTERAIADAMSFAREELDLVVEGSAAVVIAWLRQHAGEVASPIVGVVSGGNVDPSVLIR